MAEAPDAAAHRQHVEAADTSSPCVLCDSADDRLGPSQRTALAAGELPQR